MRTKIKLLFVSLLMCFSILAKAQSSDTLEVSLNQAMAYATEFGYQSINAQTDIEIAKKKVRETLAIGLPQINASGSVIDKIIIPEVAFAGQTFKIGSTYNGSIGGQIDQLLFDGSYLVGLKASKIYVQLSENAKEKTDIEIKKAVSEAYFLVLVAQNNIRNFEQNLETNKKSLKQTTAYFNNGLREDIDVDQVQLMVNESKRLFLDASRQLTIAKAVLKFSMGYDIDKPLKVSDTFNGLLATIPINHEVNQNILTHIDYRSMSTQIDIKQLDIKNQKAQAMPKLSAYANYNYQEFGDHLDSLKSTKASDIGITLSIPIFSSGMRSAKLKQKKLELNKLEVERRMLEQSLIQEVLIAKSNLRNAKEQYDNTQKSKEIADRIYKKSLLKFENGMLNSLELSQNENKMVEAILSFSQASANYFNSYIQYKKATSQL